MNIRFLSFKDYVQRVIIFLSVIVVVSACGDDDAASSPFDGTWIDTIAGVGLIISDNASKIVIYEVAVPNDQVTFDLRNEGAYEADNTYTKFRVPGSGENEIAEYTLLKIADSDLLVRTGTSYNHAYSLFPTIYEKQ